MARLLNVNQERPASQEPAPPPTPSPIPRQQGCCSVEIQDNWKKPVIHTRDICHFGPNPIRDRESVIKSAETLVRHGSLVPMKPHRCDTKRWQIAIGPD